MLPHTGEDTANRRSNANPSREAVPGFVRLLTWLIAIGLGYSFLVLGISLRDRYVAYSGTVIAKGVSPTLHRTTQYLVIRDSSGHDHRRYVTPMSGGWIPVGTFVVKRRGLSATVETPGKLTPWQMLDSADKVLARHGIRPEDKNDPLQNPGAFEVFVLVCAVAGMYACSRVLRASGAR
ncbi:MAG TPA: hypothetical protein VN706_17955 [Gemmatimonadaceae bacterium]|nr:hypothetical protein [Gemmatimonadaceae bacterium]